MAHRASFSHEPHVLFLAMSIALVWSGIRPLERRTWILEVAPISIGATILVATFSRFRLSPLLYRLLFLHAIILLVGGHYTYARVPVGFWVQNAFDLSRNHYDRLGHFAQGFVPAILAREVLLRRSPLRSGRWLFFLVLCICLALSAMYELVEWWTALVGGDSAESFLGTQGDVWDTQWDMFLALIGCVSAQILLSQAHDKSLASIGARPS